MKGRALRNFLTGTGSLAYFLQGYTQSILNGLVTLSSFLQYFPEMDTVTTHGAQKSHNLTIQGTVVAVYEVGGAVGGILCFLLANRMGRKRIMYSATVLQIIGGSLQTSAFSVAQMIVGRVLTGIGMGAYCATIPMWLCECIGAAHRGKAVLLCGGLGDLGMVVANWVDFGFFYAGQSAVKWRVPLGLQLPGAVVILGLTPWLPESPRWLSEKREQAKALLTLADLSGRKGLSPLDPQVHQDLDSMMHKVHKEKSGKIKYRVFLAIFINMMSCMSGISILTFFSTEVLETQMNFSSEGSRLISAGLQMVRLIFSFFSMALVDKVGRRPLMLIASAGMGVSMLAQAILLNDHASQGMLYAALVFQFTCMAFYPIGFHLMPTMYASEIAPAKYRHKVAAGSNSVHWMFNFMIAEVSPIAFNTIGSYYYVIYAIANFITFITVFFLYLETKGLSLEQIEHVFSELGSVLKIQAVRQQILKRDDVSNEKGMCEEFEGQEESDDSDTLELVHKNVNLDVESWTSAREKM